MANLDNQNFWQLASIQSAAQGLAVMLVGQKIASQYGSGTALISICIGNLILWFFGLAMISMTYKTNPKPSRAQNALENVKNYLGKHSTFTTSIVLAAAFLSWFTVQLGADTTATNSLVQDHPAWSLKSSLELASLLAIIITCLSMGGIKSIKWVCVISFPFLFSFLIYALIFEKGSTIPPFDIKWRDMFPSTITALAIVLPGIINLPTFFRHSRSRSHAILALSLMTIFVSAFQFGSLWLNFSDPNSTIFKPYSINTGWTLNLIFSLGFIKLSTLCINLVNIYFASVVLEMIKPRFADARGYVLIGLVGTLGFGLIQSMFVMGYIQNLTNCIIGCLGVTLVVGNFTTMITQHRNRPHERHVNSGCWLVGSLSSAWAIYTQKDEIQAFITGISVTFLCYILILFYEEIHSIIKKPKKN